jgi:hypothetical protein
MSFERRIIHYDNDATTVKNVLSDAADDSSRVTSAWFELLRKGGCGAGGITLRDVFTLSGTVEIGDYIAFDYDQSSAGRWYVGRVEDVSESSPVGVNVSLYGPVVEMTEIFPGGFTNQDANAPPQRFAKSDYFNADPDYLNQTWDAVSQPWQVANILFDRLIKPRTNIDYKLIEAGSPPVGIESVLFRGEESVHQIIRNLAMTDNDSSWGVTEERIFFLLQKRNTAEATFQEGVDAYNIVRKTDRSLLYNRIMFVGGYVYGTGVNHGFYRYQANFVQAESRDLYGERRIAIHVPWIRRNVDAVAFAETFFSVYSEPTVRCSFVVNKDMTTSLPYHGGAEGLPRPWGGEITLLDRDGDLLQRSTFDRMRVRFDAIPKFEITLGTEEVIFPSPPEPQRFEIAQTIGSNGEIAPSEQVLKRALFSGISDEITALAST